MSLFSKKKRTRTRERTKPAKRSSSNRLATVLVYAKAGLRVAQVYGVKGERCNCGDEDCARAGTHLRSPNGIEDATMEPAEIEALESWSSSRIAIETGVDGVIALVVNGKKPQAALAEALSSAATVQVIDGNARTYLWKAPAEVVPDGRVLVRKGVEVLGRGEYFMAPNDLNTTSRKRRFAVDGVVGQVDIAAAPEWLLTSLRPHLLGITAKPPSPGAKRVRFKTIAVDLNCIVDDNDLIRRK
jgi:putative DNA primase/helicase